MMKIPRRKRNSRATGGHYFRRAKTQPIWICIADHGCSEIRDRYGRPITTAAARRATGA